MATEKVRRPPWVNDAVAFIGLVVLDATLMWIGLSFYRAWDRGEPEWVHWWLWTFAAPVWTARANNQHQLHWPLVWLNPFVYGAVWWFLWRLLRLFRLK